MNFCKPVSLFLFLLISFFAGAQKYPQDYFRSPLEIPLYLSGTFGELRTNHFHSGLDIKTDQREGQRVLAAADGVVSRIKVSPYGFGNAIYINHPNGYTTVYAHLQRFNDEIQAYVRKEQYRQKSFDIELFPPAGRFEVKKGDLIALSGNSGGSGGPHLHFEIRNTRTEKIINPLLFGIDVKDSRNPDLYNLEVYEFDKNELVSSYEKNLIRTSAGDYSLTGNNVVEVSHSPAFGITAYDRQDGANNRNGVYSIQMWIGGVPFYDFEAKTFAFDETRYVNAHIDYAQKICCGRVVNKLYLEPNNQFSAYEIDQKMNFPSLVEDSVYQVKIVVKDAAGNESDLNFGLKYAPPVSADDEAAEAQIPVFRYAQSNYFKKDNFQIVLPEGALYNDVYAEYNKNQPCSECYSYIHEIASREIPVHKYYTIKIKPDAEFSGDKSKLAIASFRNGKIDDYEGGSWENGFVTARTRQFGQFAIVADTIAPTIRPIDFRDGSDISRFNRLEFIIDDNFSGIDSYTPTIDGQWVLFQYDYKNKMIWSDLSELNLEAGEHVLELTVQDEKGNVTTKTYHLIF